MARGIYKNPRKGNKWMNPMKEFISKVNLYDEVLYQVPGQEEKTGKVTFITERGVNVVTGHGDLFVKWLNVLEVRK